MNEAFKKLSRPQYFGHGTLDLSIVIFKIYWALDRWEGSNKFWMDDSLRHSMTSPDIEITLSYQMSNHESAILNSLDLDWKVLELGQKR